MPHLPHVARFARALTRDPVRAEDLVQETYVRALHGWHTFRTGSDAGPWLFKVCHNAFLRSVQQEAKYVAPPDDDPELESLATAQAHWRAEEAGLTDVVERMDLGAAIGRALAALPAYFRGAVVLVDVEGKSYDEAAEVLDVPVARCALGSSAPGGCCRISCSSTRATPGSRRHGRPHPRPLHHRRSPHDE